MVVAPVARRSCQPRGGESEQVVGAAREFRAGRDRCELDRSPLARSVDESPVGDVDAAGARVVEFDELVRRIGAGIEADLVDLDRENVSHPRGCCLELFPAGCRTRPLRFTNKETGAGRARRGDLERRADARTRRDRNAERHRITGRSIPLARKCST